MANYNKVLLVGRLTRDPELSYTANQTAVCSFGLAVNRKFKDQEETCFVECTAWGKTGELVNQYLSKGREALIDGRLTFDSWEGKDGKRQSKLKVTVENVQFLGGRAEEGEPGGRQAAPPMGGNQAPQRGDYGPANSKLPKGPPPPPREPNASYEAAEAAGGDSIPF